MMLALELIALTGVGLCGYWLYRECQRLVGRNLSLGLDNAELRRHLADVQAQRDSLYVIARTMGAIIKQQGDDIDVLLAADNGWESPQNTTEAN